MASKKTSPARATSRSPARAPLLSREQLNRATLARQMLLAREDTSILSAITRLVGLQAQWPRPPFVGLWSRLASFEASALRALVASRKVVRATSLRATLHLMTAEDFARLRPALQPMMTGGLASILKERLAGLDVPRLVTDARELLSAQPSTFTALRGALAARYPGVDERAMGYSVRLSTPLVVVPNESAWSWPGNPSFTPADAWLGEAWKPGNADDLRPLIRRYLAAHGPASVRDAKTWSAHQALEDTFDSLREELVTFTDDKGRELFDLPDAPRPPADVPAPVRFLPEWDNLLLAHADRRRVVDDGDRKKIFHGAAIGRPAFLVNGRAEGTWKYERRKKAATLTVEPFAPLTKAAKKELEAEGVALCRFLEPDATTHDVVFAAASGR